MSPTQSHPFLTHALTHQTSDSHELTTFKPLATILGTHGIELAHPNPRETQGITPTPQIPKLA